jgi:DNA-binding NarL/FixJ family response regulator
LLRLSGRELEVLRLVADGWRSAAIAAELGIKESTVKTHLVHIFRKLEVSNRVEAATRYARAKHNSRPG